MNANDHLSVSGLTKRYGGAAALDDVDITIRRGEIHGLVGENGAGKSTLCKIIAGAVLKDAGEIVVNGRAVAYRSPTDAIADGVTLIAQEVALVPDLDVLANVFLGNESTAAGVLRNRDLRRRYAVLNERLRFDIPARALVRELPFGDQQKVEILRALARESELIILDEPTASLGPADAEILFAALKSLRDHGTTIIYISHHLDEVLRLADRVTVMRDGRVVRTAATNEEDEQSLILGMLGRPLDSVFPDRKSVATTGTPALSVRGLTAGGRFTGIDLDVYPGEVVGVAGLVGAGRSEVARAIFGADRFDSGRVLIDGEEVRLRTPRAAARRGIAMVPESRRDQGLILPLPTYENLALVGLDAFSTAGVVRSKKLRRAGDATIAKLDIRAKNPRAAVGLLSGGNQQKVLFGKWLMTPPRVLIVDEPTRGVDVGAKRAIYELIADLAGSGVAVLLISSELEEVIGLSHRVLVMRRGKIAASLESGQITESAIMTAAFSHDDTPA